VPATLVPCQSRPSSPELRPHIQPQYPDRRIDGRRIVICDYNALLLSVTGLLRMSGYTVFQAHDGWAAHELCVLLPNIELLVLNTYGTGIDVAELCRRVRSSKRGLPILHIGSTSPDGLPQDVPTLSEKFTADSLLAAVKELMEPALVSALCNSPQPKPLSYPNGRRREDTGSRSGTLPTEPFSRRVVEAAPISAPGPVASSWSGRLWHWMTTGGSA
jgi:CheY-like chemotaxis protein